MRTPKTLSDLPRWLREQFESLQHLDTFGLPDHGDFDEFEAAAHVNECQRVACGFGAPLVDEEQTVTSVREGIEIVGQLLAWAVDKTAKNGNTPLNVKEAARRLGIGAQRVYGLCQAGTLRCLKIGRTVRIAPDEIERFLAEQTEAAKPEPLPGEYTFLKLKSAVQPSPSPRRRRGSRPAS